MSYLRYLSCFLYIVVSNIVLCFCCVFLRLVYHMFPVSLNRHFFIAPSVFSNLYHICLTTILHGFKARASIACFNKNEKS